MSERNEYDEHNGQTEAAEQSRPEYVDFTVDDFPGGLAAGLEAILMVADQPQTVEDMARVLQRTAWTLIPVRRCWSRLSFSWTRWDSIALMSCHRWSRSCRLWRK